MRLNDVNKAYQSHPSLVDFADALQVSDHDKFRITGTAGSQPAFLIANLYRLTQKNTLVILDDKEEALYFLNDLKSVMPKKEILFFPASYKRPYQIEEIDNANVLQRAEVLNQLNHTQSGRQLIVTFAEALSEKVINKRSLVKNTLEIKVGEKCGMDFVIDVLNEYHFEREEFVYEPGQFAVRGGILDVFSFAHELPVRIDFFGDEIEGIRPFDPVSQLSEGQMSGISLIPNIQKNLLNEEKVHFLEYISPNTKVYIRNPSFVLADLDKQFKRAVAHYEELHQKSGGGAVSSDPDQLYTSGKLFEKQLDNFTTIEFASREYFKQHHQVLRWEGGAQPTFHKEFELLAAHLKENTQSGINNLIFSAKDKQILRLEEIMQEISEGVQFLGMDSDIHKGFLDKMINIACYTDHQIFERYHRYKSRANVSRSQALTLKELKDLNPGDFVTHVHHGIGKFAGLHKIKTGEVEQEAVKIIYQAGDAIFVNVNSLYKISKFSGKDGTQPKLSKLGSGEWARKKSKARKRIKDLAFDLIALYAKRKTRQGFRFTPDSYLQQELEASFMYEDTPDQEKATEDVKNDMESPIPMDRLVCGDVGFGKTEIAIRAAFKAATDGKQVAVLVPTTILALQHYRTFKDRLKDFPIEVDYLNRFRTTKQTKDILKRLEEGKLEIVIGTHRIVSKDIKFKDLGLMIIDEEQKFGVGVKEKLKTIKVSVDTLTLTATPIPRTLQFSLLGLRDLSIIATPPPNRQPVETVVYGFDQEVIRDAISYELKRGGQVFFVHNRVADLEEMGAMVKKLVPDARVAIAHGQMPGEKVERVMSQFIEGAYDVLICTTIIESGLDISNANTILINQAHMYGLSDLHQMRGRVGRSNRKAFCYLLAPHETLLSRDAKKRLKAIEEFSDIGSGFHIALQDLDIRGAGDLLGPEQSGFINEVGYDTYHKILDEVINELKEEHFADVFQDEIRKRRINLVDDCVVETDLRILIPEHYIPSISERLTFYNRVASSENEKDLRQISVEMIDRFGPLPEPVLGLLDTVRIRWIGKELAFEKVVLKRNSLRLYFVGKKDSPFFQSDYFVRFMMMVQQHSGRIKLKESPKYLSLVIKGVDGVKSILAELNNIKAYVKEEAETVENNG